MSSSYQADIYSLYGTDSGRRISQCNEGVAE